MVIRGTPGGWTTCGASPRLSVHFAKTRCATTRYPGEAPDRRRVTLMMTLMMGETTMGETTMTTATMTTATMTTMATRRDDDDGER